MTDKKYPSDLTDEEWEVIKVILLKEEGRSMGRPREVDLRRVWDAISYINKTGCQWEYLPHDFPPPTTVNYHYQKWLKSGIFEQVNQEVRRMLRKKNGRNEEPSAGILVVSLNCCGESRCYFDHAGASSSELWYSAGRSAWSGSRCIAQTGTAVTMESPLKQDS